MQQGSPLDLADMVSQDTTANLLMSQGAEGGKKGDKAF